MAAKSPKAAPDQPEREPEYVVIIPFNRIDPYSLHDTRYEVGDPYPSDGPAIDEYLDRGLIVRPAAESASESTEDQEK